MAVLTEEAAVRWSDPEGAPLPLLTPPSEPEGLGPFASFPHQTLAMTSRQPAGLAHFGTWARRVWGLEGSQTLNLNLPLPPSLANLKLYVSVISPIPPPLVLPTHQALGVRKALKTCKIHLTGCVLGYPRETLSFHSSGTHIIWSKGFDKRSYH